MSYSLKISDKLDRQLQKLAKKDKKQMNVINKKIEQILRTPHHFKPLRGDMFGARRVHIAKSFVLTYEIDEDSKFIKLLDYEHHDKIY